MKLPKKQQISSRFIHHFLYVHILYFKSHKMIKTRKINNSKEGEFLSDIAGIVWEQMLTKTDNINALVNHLTKISLLISTPRFAKCLSQKGTLLGLIKDLRSYVNKRQARKACCKSKSSLIMDSYRQIRYKVNSLNIQLKKEYYSNKISTCKGTL